MIPARYEMAYKYAEGLAAVKDGGKWGYIDATGKMAIAPQFSEAYVFDKGLAQVRVGKHRGYIDHTGKYVWGPAD